MHRSRAHVHREQSRLAVAAAILLLASGCTPREQEGQASSAAGAARVVAAASMRDALEEIMRSFHARQAATGWRVEIVYTASGAAYQQILAGAPFHLFVAADAVYPRALEERARTEPDSRRVYACGTLALWRAHRAGGDGDMPEDWTTLAALAGDDVRRIAVANGETAPYGRAALEALRAAGVEELVRAKLVTGQDAAQAAQIALAGADAALLPRSAMIAPAFRTRGRWSPIDPRLHAPLAHSLVLIRRDDEPPPAAARALHAMLLSGAAAEPLRRHGLALPRRSGDVPGARDDDVCEGAFTNDDESHEPRDGAR